jgi:hypothetical protein
VNPCSVALRRVFCLSDTAEGCITCVMLCKESTFLTDGRAIGGDCTALSFAKMKEVQLLHIGVSPNNRFLTKC